jgi:hypothetical protein
LQVRAVVGRVASRAGGDKAANRKCASRLMLPETFEKDQDANGHMAFITAASNLRAINYGIAPADRLQVCAPCPRSPISTQPGSTRMYLHAPHEY